MAPYFVLLGAPIIFSLFYNLRSENVIEEKTRAKIKNYNVLIFFFIFFLLLALRSSRVGVDTSIYKAYFFEMNSMRWSECFHHKDLETGYLLFSKLMYVISGGNFQIFLGAVALLCCLPIAVLYYKESENSVVTILLFMTATSIDLMFFSGLRQAIAISLAAVAFYFVKNKKIFYFLIVAFLAVSFHSSAIILIFLYPVYHIKLRPAHAIMILVPMAALTYVFRSQLYTFLLPLAGEEYVEKYGKVQDTGAITMIILVALFVVFSFVVPDEEKMDDESIGMRNILSVSLLLQIFATTNFIAMRFNYYFLLFLPLVIPRVINRWKGDDKNSKLITNIVLIVFFAVYYFSKSFSGVDTMDIYPYEFFWQ
ncbi:MAG: EpsG family protein [Acutalibacteraceae bacterium]|nr:EpsG family protein [Acutalibacteraceae bacterium]